VIVWLTIVAAGIGCYLLRISLVALLGGRQLSPADVRTAGYVMPAAFASLAAVAVLDATQDSGSGTVDPAPLLGALVAAGVAKRTSSSTAALVAGLTAAAAVTAAR
jgi:branched-subunit amino acid transport protein